MTERLTEPFGDDRPRRRRQDPHVPPGSRRLLSARLRHRRRAPLLHADRLRRAAGHPGRRGEDAAGRREPPRLDRRPDRRPGRDPPALGPPVGVRPGARDLRRDRLRRGLGGLDRGSGQRARQPPAGAAAGPSAGARRGGAEPAGGRRRAEGRDPGGRARLLRRSGGGRPPLAHRAGARLRARPRQAAALPHPGRDGRAARLPRPRPRARAAAGRGAAAALGPFPPGERGLREAARARRGDGLLRRRARRGGTAPEPRAERSSAT